MPLLIDHLLSLEASTKFSTVLNQGNRILFSRNQKNNGFEVICTNDGAEKRAARLEAYKKYFSFTDAPIDLNIS